MFITLEGPGRQRQDLPHPRAGGVSPQAGHEVVVTREPGGTPIGDEIRDTLLKMGNTAMHPTTEILLFQASRAQHVQELILPVDGRGQDRDL